ncbi:molecular chaperone-like protein [Methylobacterium planeticum]|uniref:Molecular chaperone-like protein n=1 Tax=Methylobacterium planeticum TaxID=2615211 RepID=A0A6N6MYD8_9HYPH|nr:molecular chaperone-like protein [Methylobacterium planeticum]KAB1074352.1 molecular chaperone-like protein [Methylobacterium planeticum]
MTGFRWIALLAVALLITVAVAVLALRATGQFRTAGEDAAGKPAIPACDPVGYDKGPRPAECPQAAPPTARTP